MSKQLQHSGNPPHTLDRFSSKKAAAFQLITQTDYFPLIGLKTHFYYFPEVKIISCVTVWKLKPQQIVIGSILHLRSGHDKIY